MEKITDAREQNPYVVRNPNYDRFEHYQGNVGPTHEFGDLEQTAPSIRNIGWTLGNDCPYRCTHCYSMNARERGANMSKGGIDRIVEQLAINGVETVNLGGNEPLFTNGLRPADSLLPYIIETLVKRGIIVGLTTSGITVMYLYRHHRHAFDLLNDIDISFDSPFRHEHDQNRGAAIFHQAIETMEVCQRHHKPHTAIMCAMSWNFDYQHIDALVELAKRYDANVRINPIKPVEPAHMSIALPAAMYFAGFSRLLELCEPLDLGEPPIAAVTNYRAARRCPCGRTSFRIHSITPRGEIHVSPCVYVHDYKSSLDLLKRDLADIIHSPQFRVFRQRNANPEKIDGCVNCSMLQQCGGGCAGRSYLYHSHETGGEKSMLARDPYCPKRIAPTDRFETDPTINTTQRLVHMDYLCTWIGRPR
jgi:radical SAM protein with 4Fe4S-binding SPASM domain